MSSLMEVSDDDQPPRLRVEPDGDLAWTILTETGDWVGSAADEQQALAWAGDPAWVGQLQDAESAGFNTALAEISAVQRAAMREIAIARQGLRHGASVEKVDVFLAKALSILSGL